MKKIHLLLVLTFLAQVAFAQVTIYLNITDDSRIIDFDSGIPVFDDPDINDIFDSYTVSHFAKTAPFTEYQYLKRYYTVECDSEGLAIELNNDDSDLFPFYAVAEEYYPGGTFYPSDTTQYEDYLWYINMQSAWDKSKGDSNIIIGVTDTYFDTAHEDMSGKYAMVRANTLASANDSNHGTLVAGIIAAKTNNGTTGYPGVAYDCRLDVSSDWGKINVLHNIAVNGNRRVVNASWGRTGPEILYFNYSNSLSFLEQGLCNEMYENGTSVICAAGNGTQEISTNDPWRHFFPASYDHSISVTNVGWENTTGTGNLKDIHEITLGDTVNQIYQHNTRIDICAPAVRIGGHNYSPTDPNNNYQHAAGWGTSFAAPQVAGVAGLILSKKPWLTPYQIEYILKKSAINLDNIPANTKYAGRLGAGKLDAGAALDSVEVDSFIADYPATLTFRIKGVKVSHKCEPGARPSVADPTVEVVMENGTPPYKYKWEQITGGNDGNNFWIFPRYDSTGTNTIIDTITSKISTSGTSYFHYRLTVYDNSDIQKVASKVIRFQLSNDTNKYDLAMQDSYADQYDEPNEQHLRNPNEWDIWTSPDVWNRLAQDGDTVHQDAVYSALSPNYMHVRVRNVGCATSPDEPDIVNVLLYWTIQSTGEKWPDDWIGNTTINGHVAGGKITGSGIPIPPLDPGDETILSYDWNPPRPQDFDTTGAQRIDVCALARIQTDTSQNNDYGMTFTEVDTNTVNVRNNNNIATRNFVTHNLSSTNNPTTRVVVIVGNTSGSSSGFDIEMITDNQISPHMSGHLASYMEATLYLGDLYDIWVDGGRAGNPTSYDDDDNTVTWDLEEPLRLNDLTLAPDDKYWVEVEFTLKSGTSIPYEINGQAIHFRQLYQETVDIDMGDGTSTQVEKDVVFGNVTHSINIEQLSSGAKPARTNIEELEFNSVFEIYPNPVQNILSIVLYAKDITAQKVTIVDVSGKLIFDDVDASFKNGKYNINTCKLISGVYFVTISTNNGETYTKRFVKVE